MRVLYITHLTECNGATLALRNIMEGMIVRGVEVGLIVPDTKGFICEEARRLGITILYNFSYPWALLKGQVSFKMWLLVQWKTYKLIKDFKPDIVHCNTGIIDYPLLGCLLTRTPMVWHAREYIDKDFGREIKGGMMVHRYIMKSPFIHCIAITKGIFQHFNLNKKKDIAIYDGVIDNKRIDISNASIADNKKYFLYVGSFIEGKGVHTIFEQFGHFHSLHPDVELWLACNYDTNSNYYKQCISHAIKGNFIDQIKFLGFRTDVYQLMQGAIALIVPSRFEGFGFITVEAMYNSCLVIGRNTAGTKEQFDIGLEETGQEIGLRYSNDEELSGLMNYTLKNDCFDIKERAYNVVVHMYSTKHHNIALHAYYHNIAPK